MRIEMKISKKNRDVVITKKDNKFLILVSILENSLNILINEQ